MANQTFQGIKSGISPSDVKRALANGGDISLLAQVLIEALNYPPVEVAATLEMPLPLPEASVLIPEGETLLPGLVESWRDGEGSRAPDGSRLENTEIVLLPLPPHGKNVANYLERIVAEVQPDIIALDESEGELSAAITYAVSLPAALGTTVYAEIRLKEEGKPYGSRVFYPGSLDETVIVQALLRNIPLVPVGKPYPAGSTSLKLNDEDIEDEDGSGLHIQDAYVTMDEFLGNNPYLKLLAENAASVGATLENSVSSHINHKLIREANYAASRLSDLAYSLDDAEKTKILAVIDMKRYPAVARYLDLILSGSVEEDYVRPDKIAPEPMLMLGRHAPSAGEALPGKTPTERLFEEALEKWSDGMRKEVLDAVFVDRYIAFILERVRTHPQVLRGASVRGSLGLKEVASGLAELDSGITREGIEKAALITLPARLRLKPGTKATPIDVVSESAKEALYGVEFYHTVFKVGDGEGNAWLSPEEVNKLLENLSKEKKPGENGEKPDENDEKRLKILEAQKLLRHGVRTEFVLTARAIERLMEDLEKRARAGKLTPEELEKEKARLKEMLAAARASEQTIPARDVAGLIIDFMDVVDKHFEGEWGNDINFLRVFMYYRQKFEEHEALYPWQGDWAELQQRLHILEKRGILKITPQQELAVSGLGLSVLLEYVVPRNPELKSLQKSISYKKTLIPLRSEEIRPFTVVNTYRDISFRHTLKEVAKQRKELENVRKSDFRVYIKQRNKLVTDFVICLDTSGSMAEHRKLVYARLAAAAVTAAAKENGDRTAVVSFEDAGRTSIPLSDESNDLVNDYLVALGANGATNMGDGIKCAVDLLTRDINHNKKRIFLITDGEPNAISEKAMKSLQGNKEATGDLTEEAALVETRRAAARGITISVIYMAADKMKGYNFAKSIARAGKGQVIMINCRDEQSIIPETGKPNPPGLGHTNESFLFN